MECLITITSNYRMGILLKANVNWILRSLVLALCLWVPQTAAAERFDLASSYKAASSGPIAKLPANRHARLNRSKEPTSPLGHYQIGLKLSKLQRYHRAIQYFNKAIQLDPYFSEAHLSIGIAYYNLKKYNLALHHFSSVLKNDPENSPANFFSGLLFQRKGDYAKSNAYFREAMGQDREFNQLALFNIGLNNHKMGESRKARDTFALAMRVDPRSETARNSEQFLDILEERTVESSRRRTLGTSFGFSFTDSPAPVSDDNPLVPGPSKQASWLAGLKGSYDYFENRDIAPDTGYGLFQQLYQDRQDLDLELHRFNLGGGRKIGRFDFNSNYSYTVSTLDEDRFLGIHNLNPGIGLSLLNNSYTFFQYSFQDKKYFTDDRRDAVNHGVGVDHFLFFNGRQSYVSMGYRLESESAKDEEFDFLGHQFSVRYQVPVFRQARFGMAVEYQLRDYDNLTPDIGTPREDQRLYLKMGLSQEIMKRLDLKLDYQYINSDSNQASSNFDENIIQLGFEFKM